MCIPPGAEDDKILESATLIALPSLTKDQAKLLRKSLPRKMDDAAFSKFWAANEIQGKEKEEKAGETKGNTSLSSKARLALLPVTCDCVVTTQSLYSLI